MKRCIELAVRGLGSVAPNPLVGSVLVRNGAIIGEGFHEKYGESHAEVNAIRSVANPDRLRESTLYINLEPCSHFGKTPPCADLIIEKEIPSVVVGCRDSNEKVNGKGISKLKAAGIQVIEDVLFDESRELNRRFFTFHEKTRPYVILKWAETGDGYIAKSTGESKWISSEESRTLVHQWRAEEAAVLVGTTTAVVDNPELTVRQVKGKNPLRVTLDRTGRIPETHHLLNGSAETLVFSSGKDRVSGSATFLPLDWSKNPIRQILNELHSRGVQSILIEGGAATLQSFISHNVWDEARIFTAKNSFGEGILAPKFENTATDTTNVGVDQLSVYRNATSA